MSKLRFLAMVILLWWCSASTTTAQKKDTTWLGKLAGTVRDSTHDYELSAATIALYTTKDSSLVAFQLTSNNGTFSLNQLPIGRSLYLAVSYLGYQTCYLPVIIPPANPSLQLGEINLSRKNNELPGIEITIPPVSFNGDTLEFNAAAFKIDPAAQTEDLLKLLPGVIVWNDGSITVNGKQVSSVLVNGKPFFGGDTKVATQNIPKNVVDKIQVYNTRKSANNPLDSILEVNIKLLKGKEVGYFGKISAGAGTEGHYEADGSINFFSKSNQLSLVAATNNVNKGAKDLKTLLRNSTFKGIGTSLEYQPELMVQGLRSTVNAGISWQHDFIPDQGGLNKNSLALSYFLDNIHQSLSNESQIQSVLQDGAGNTRESHTTNKTYSSDHTFNTSYEKNNGQNRFSSMVTFHKGNLNSTERESTQSSDHQHIALSQYTQRSDIDSKFHLLNWQLEATRKKPVMKSNLRPGDYQVKYSLAVKKNETGKIKQTEFVAFNDAMLSRFYDRKYEEKSDGILQRLDLKFGNLLPWIFGAYSPLSRFDLQLINSLELNQQKDNEQVYDRFKTADTYLTNASLTANQQNLTINEAPGITLSRHFLKLLDFRYEKNLQVALTLQYQLYKQKNESTQERQRFELNTARFAPKLNIVYSNNQINAYRDIYTLLLERQPEYPTAYQMVPLTDSIDQYTILLSNTALRPGNKYQASFLLRHEQVSASTPFNYFLNITGGWIKNPITEEISTDQVGRQTFRYINLGTAQYASANIEVNKAFKFRSNLFQLQFSGISGFRRKPNRNNGISNITRSRNNNVKFSISYSTGQFITLDLSQQFNSYVAIQKNISAEELRSYTYSTTLSTNCNVTSRLAFSTNISYNNNSGYRVVNFALWNASAMYRLTKAKTTELRFSAMDLLRQNKGIFYDGSNNMLTTSMVNVLRQYFILSVAYYPRKFGKNEKKSQMN